MGGRRKKIIKILPKSKPQNEYDLKHSFSKLNPYRSSNNYQTDTSNEQYDSSASNNNLPQNAYLNSSTGTISDTYFRLENKISALSDKNDNAHDNLRRDLHNEINTLRGDFDKHCQGHSDNTKWVINTIIAIAIAVLGYILLPYQKINSVHEDVVKIQTTIDENIKPSLEQNGKAIDQNAKDIKSNTEKIYQLQNQPQKKQK